MTPNDRPSPPPAPSRITVVTFGFKYGPPPTNHTFDVSFLANPARDARWGLLSEPDDAMREFVLAQPAAAEFVARATELAVFLSEQDDDLRIGLGCSTGRHRCSLVAEALCDALANRGFDVLLVRREGDFGDYGERIDATECPSFAANRASHEFDAGSNDTPSTDTDSFDADSLDSGSTDSDQRRAA